MGIGFSQWVTRSPRKTHSTRSQTLSGDILFMISVRRELIASIWFCTAEGRGVEITRDLPIYFFGDSHCWTYEECEDMESAMRRK